MKRIALVLCLMAAGCGGGSGGGGPTAPPPAPPPPTTGLFFEASGAPGSGTIHLEAAANTGFGSNFVLRVEANDFSDLFGVSFDLSFPKRRLNFLENATSEGTFLSENGAVETAFEILRKPAGNLIVGVTRLGDVGGASGSGTLLTIEFEITGGGGQGDLTFSDNDAVDRDREFLDATVWLGGSIEVLR